MFRLHWGRFLSTVSLEGRSACACVCAVVGGLVWIPLGTDSLPAHRSACRVWELRVPWVLGCLGDQKNNRSECHAPWLESAAREALLRWGLNSNIMIFWINNTFVLGLFFKSRSALCPSWCHHWPCGAFALWGSTASLCERRPSGVQWAPPGHSGWWACLPFSFCRGWAQVLSIPSCTCYSEPAPVSTYDPSVRVNTESTLCRKDQKYCGNWSSGPRRIGWRKPASLNWIQKEFGSAIA